MPSSRRARIPARTPSRSPRGPSRAAAPEELPAARRKRAAAVLERLRREFPRPVTALRHENPFQLLIATILSAQCTDERVNMVTPGLFSRYPSPALLAAAAPAELEREIRSTGFFRMKAKSIRGCSAAIVERHGGVVPGSLDELTRLPGVGRKTANVVLGQAFGVASGVVVDTHVHRLSGRLAFSTAATPEKIEQDLMGVFRKADWIEAGSLLILHGRKTCAARKPRCGECTVRDLCPSAALVPPSRA